MIRKVIIACVVFSLPLSVWGQFSSERSALNNIEKQKWEKAYNQLRKVLDKDSLHAAAHFVLAKYFFAPQNPGFQIDSAHNYYVNAIHDFQLSPVRLRDKMKRLPLDSAVLSRLGAQIDSAAFARASLADTEDAYRKFLTTFTTALQRDSAIHLRDAAAYRVAEEKNTYNAFATFVSKYPKAREATAARERYETLLFQDKTADKRLASYERFLKEYPNTTYRHQAEQRIFEISTASGSVALYQQFLERYPDSYLAPRVRNMYYHLLPDDEREAATMFTSDSLDHVQDLEAGYLVPFLKESRFGFMNPAGNEIIPPDADDIADDYRCGNITEDVLVLPGKLLSRNGSVIYHGQASSLDDLGQGFLLVETDSCVKVVHKTGFIVGDTCATDARLLANRLLALKRNDRWSIWTLSGVMLQPYSWEDVSSLQDIIVYRDMGKIRLATVEQVAAIANGAQLKLNDVYDEVKPWPGNRIWVRAGDYEGVLDQHLNAFVNFDKHTLTSTFFGAQGVSPAGITTFAQTGEASPMFRQVQVHEPWVSAKANQSWRLFDVIKRAYISPSYDSIAQAGPFAIGINADSVHIYFPAGVAAAMAQPVRFEFVPGQDTSAFIIIDQAGKRALYNHQGKKLFAVTYDKVQYAGQGFFIISKREKKGLIDREGKTVLPIEYDAVGTAGKGTVSLLRAMKFGLYDYEKRKLIRPVYSKNIIPYTAGILTAFKPGGYGFVAWDEKPLSQFDFSEIQYWNDTTALVRKGDRWALYSIPHKRYEVEDIKSVKSIRDKAGDRVVIIRQGDDYGVIGSRAGIIIPIRYSDVINVGSPEVPLYFTEKHVEEASLFVVIYYDHTGKMIRREVYEQDDYEKIYCHN